MQQPSTATMNPDENQGNHVDVVTRDEPVVETLQASVQQCIDEVRKCVQLVQSSVQERRIPRHWRRAIRRLELLFMIFYLGVIVLSLALLMWPNTFY